jgi:hypothetical protein
VGASLFVYEKRDKARLRVEELCHKFSVECFFHERESYDNSFYFSAQFSNIIIDIYHDGALIYSVDKEIDIRFEKYDYKELSDMFRNFITKFFHQVINVEL